MSKVGATLNYLHTTVVEILADGLRGKYQLQLCCAALVLCELLETSAAKMRGIV